MGNKNGKGQKAEAKPAAQSDAKPESKLGAILKETLPRDKREWGTVVKPALKYGGLALAGGLVFGLFAGISAMKGQREYVRQAESLGMRALTDNPTITQCACGIDSQMSLIRDTYESHLTSEARGYSERRAKTDQAREARKRIEYLRQVIMGHCDYAVGLGEIANTYLVWARTNREDALKKLRSLIDVHQPPGVSVDDPTSFSRLMELCEGSIASVRQAIVIVLRSYIEPTVPKDLYKGESQMYKQFETDGQKLLDEMENVKVNLMRNVQEAVKIKKTR